MNATTSAPNKGKVLVVDDDRLVLATVTHGLSQAGYEVIDADNGDDAILLARQHKPDLALLDIRMEGKTGFDVAAYLREYCQIPFMFLSAFSDEATINQVKALGAVTYLVKPLDIQQIVPAVEAAFAKRPAVQDAVAVIAAAGPLVAAPVEAANPLQDTVAMAVGIVMHRHSLGRIHALERLKAQAHQDGRSLESLCQRLLEAQEVLSGLGPLH
ncbi:response regulator [Aquabacterium soli]|jgi:two-component system, response regulator PdtaR|uniref:Response regulator n=1 Tax=Aquabacterium soli TaxID=2493092 RepID=A0A426V7A0_9BURK|nr:response regulator [Aquabacterium soli]RRS02680.1 response regulator [Aquabacterium soli]